MEPAHVIEKSLKWGLFLLLIPLLLLAGCSHPIEIVGEGDVVSVSGTRNCSLDDFQAGSTRCRDNLVFSDYLETYRGEPRAGWQFRRWASYCQGALNNECAFNIPGSVVQGFWGQKVGPLKAVFRSTSNTGFTTLVIGQDFLAPIAAGLEAHTANAGFDDHSTVTITGPGAQGAPLALWNNAGQRATIQSVLDTGGVEVFGMTFDPAFPTVDGYRQWVNYALGKNPDTRFFIAVPWGPDAENAGSAAYAAAYANTEQQVYTLIDSLRAKFPGVDFYAIPYGRAAVELYALYSAGNLPDISAVTGASGEAIFQDALGNPGDMLVALSKLVWLGAIYRAEPDDFAFDPGYSTDVVAMARSILAGQDRKYRAPPEIDTDTDGDGIVDRLDANPTGKPNILVIMADDLGFNDLAINNGNTQIDTPNMDQLARDGVRFTRHYASAVCSPARASFLTGYYPERLGYLPNARGISPNIETLPERLQDEGYTTWHIGKWHIGDLERTAWPDHQGFDHWFGFLNQWRLAGVHVDGELQLATPRYENPWLQGDTEPGRNFTGHLENILTDKAIAVLSELNTAQAPWFLNLWYYAPHGPLQPSAEFAQNYPDTPTGKYQALVNQLDYNVGRLIAHLQTIGALQDTLIVLVSDNGGTSAESNAPFAGKKATLTEGGIRTPLVIRWPDNAMNDQVVSDVVSIPDIYPTLLESIGVTPPAGLDGHSFYQAVEQRLPIAGRERFWDHLMTVDWVSYAGLSADGRWRLHQPYPFWGVTLDPMIFDLELDPTVSQPVVPSPPLQLAQMIDNYQAWYEDVHTVSTTYIANGNGSGVLTGSDFLRTPGFTGYTFGIAIPADYEGPVAAQAGAWALSRNGDTLTAQFGDIVLSGDIQGVNACHSTVITGYFRRQLSNTDAPDRIDLALYIDGTLADTVAVDGILPVDDVTVETLIGDPQGQAGEALAPPVILNTALNATTPLTVGTFSQGLCDGP
jgi:arylsulfatase A-like enzyme